MLNKSLNFNNFYLPSIPAMIFVRKGYYWSIMAKWKYLTKKMPL